MLRKAVVALFILVFVFALVLFGGGALMDGKIDVGTEKKLSASPEQLYSKLDTAPGIHAWWTAQAPPPGYPAMTVRKKSGPDQGRGLAVEFVGDGQVMETWTIKEHSPPGRIVYDVDFAGALTVERTLTLTPAADGSGTQVQWRETGNIDRVAFRWMKLLMPPEEIVKNFDQALSLLEKSAQSPAAPPPG